MNAITYTKDYDGNRDPSTKSRIVRVNFIGDDGKMSVPIELLRALVADLDEEGEWLGRNVSNRNETPKPNDLKLSDDSEVAR